MSCVFPQTRRPSFFASRPRFATSAWRSRLTAWRSRLLPVRAARSSRWASAVTSRLVARYAFHVAASLFGGFRSAMRRSSGLLMRRMPASNTAMAAGKFGFGPSSRAYETRPSRQIASAFFASSDLLSVDDPPQPEASAAATAAARQHDRGRRAFIPLEPPGVSERGLLACQRHSFRVGAPPNAQPEPPSGVLNSGRADGLAREPV